MSMSISTSSSSSTTTIPTASPPTTPFKRKLSTMVSSSSDTNEATSLLRFTLPPIPDLPFPPAPRIVNAQLERQVFTHSSLLKKRRQASSLSLEEPIEDNEKLEHVGDSIIGTVVTLLLHQLFPNLQVGPATMLKSLLVANSTLAQLSSRYDFPSRLLAGPSEQWNVRNGEKTRANLFEAYVAGLYASYLKHGDGDVNGKLIGHGNAIGNGHSNGGSAGSGPGPGPGSGLRVPTPPRTPSKRDISTADLRVDDLALDEGTSESSRCPDVAAEMDDGRAFLHVMGWLKPLFTPIARWALEELEAEQTRIDTRQAELTPDAELDQQSLGASARLNEYFTYKQGGMPEYLPTRSGSDMWTVMCIATMRDGTKHHAEATRTNKKAASNVAALKICQAVGL